MCRRRRRLERLIHIYSIGHQDQVSSRKVTHSFYGLLNSWHCRSIQDTPRKARQEPPWLTPGHCLSSWQDDQIPDAFGSSEPLQPGGEGQPAGAARSNMASGPELSLAGLLKWGIWEGEADKRARAKLTAGHPRLFWHRQGRDPDPCPSRGRGSPGKDLWMSRAPVPPLPPFSLSSCHAAPRVAAVITSPIHPKIVNRTLISKHQVILT